MSIIDTLITDRTRDDVDRVRELKAKILAGGLQALTEAEYAEFFAGMRGAYNAKDMNRVGEASNYIYNLLDDFGLRPKGYVRQKTDWTIQDTGTKEQFERYIADIRLLRDALGIIITLPENMDNLTFETANKLERVLVEAEEAAMQHEKTMYFCGDLYSGEVIE